MIPLFELFRVEADGHLIWCERADSLEMAVRRIEVLKANAPATFVLFSLETGRSRIIAARLDPASAESKSPAA